MSDIFEDTLNDIFRLIRLTGCVYFVHDFPRPWGMDVPAADVAQFHLVIEGACWLGHGGGSATLNAGEAVIFPRGDAHCLADQANSPREPGGALVRRIQQGRSPAPVRAADVATRLLCGHFEFDRAVGHPLIAELPDLVRARNLLGENENWLQAIAPLLARETRSIQPGADTMVDRLAEVLLIQVLRAHLLSVRQPKGFLAATMDRRINRALKRIHRAESDAVNLDLLARDAGMSRSSFSRHFRDLMGQSPITYLISWRLMKARDWLLHGDRPIADIAELAGYTSEAAFSRAFKRQFAENPSACRG